MPRRNENRIAEAQAARQVPKIALSIDEAAWSLGVDRSTIDRMMSDGELPHTRIRSKPVIDRDDLTTLVKGNKVLRNADPGFGRRRRDRELPAAVWPAAPMARRPGERAYGRRVWPFADGLDDRA